MYPGELIIMTNQNTDLISVIVPVYNTERFLSYCIESILTQTYSNLELILVDDGSIDNSLKICREYEKHDTRVKVVLKSNSGVSDARNMGILNSSGDYISFVDADDILKEKALDILHREMIDNNVDMVFCNYEFDYSGNRVRKKARLSYGVYEISLLRKRLIDDGTMSGLLFGSVCTALYKRSIVKTHKIKFDSGIKHNEDGLFNLKYLQFCTTIKMLSDAYLYVYRAYDNSVSRTVNLKEDKFSVTNNIISAAFKDDKIIIDQLRARNVSIALWRILEICNKNNNDRLINKITAIRNVCNNQEIKQGLNYINVKNLNKYKLMYFYLLKYKRAYLLYTLTRYVYPALTKILSR
jgi:glycosyltransferase involved in cell wall biosynthesis